MAIKKIEYTGAFWDREWKGKYKPWSNTLDCIIDYDNVRGKSVLDVGCGDCGSGFGHVAQTHIGIDFSEVALKKAVKESPEAKVILATAIALPIKSNSIDIVISSCVITLLGRNAVPAIKEMLRVSREEVIFNVTHIEEFSSEPNLKGTRIEFGTLFRGRMAFTEDSMRELLDHAKAELISMTTYTNYEVENLGVPLFRRSIKEPSGDVKLMILVRARRK